jgi:hypothetical protein
MEKEFMIDVIEHVMKLRTDASDHLWELQKEFGEEDGLIIFYNRFYGGSGSSIEEIFDELYYDIREEGTRIDIENYFLRINEYYVEQALANKNIYKNFYKNVGEILGMSEQETLHKLDRIKYDKTLYEKVATKDYDPSKMAQEIDKKDNSCVSGYNSPNGGSYLDNNNTINNESAVKKFANASINFSFNEQIERVKNNTYPVGDLLRIATNTVTDLNLSYIKDVNDYPLLMRQGIIKKAEKHNISIETIKRLPDFIRSSPFAFEGNRKNSVLIILDEQNLNEQVIAIPIILDKEKGQFVINEIASIHGREFLQNTIDNTFLAGKKIFINDRSKEWAKKNGIELPKKLLIKENNLENHKVK